MDGNIIDLAIEKWQWLLAHPEVTWSGSGIYALSLTGTAVLAVAGCVRRRKKNSSAGNRFTCNSGEQNIAQGDKPIGKQVNNYFGQPLKPRTLVIAALLSAGVISLAIVGYDYFARKPAQSVTNNSSSGPQSPAIIGNNATVNYGVPLEKYEQTKKDLDVGDAALASFFKILEQGKVPREEWGAKLPEIAFRYKELLQRFESVTSDDPQVQALKEQAGQAIENGEYDRADDLLNKAKQRDRAAVSKMKANLAEQQAALEQRQLSEAESCAEQAYLQQLQYHYEKSAQYWQETATALPEGYEQERAAYLGAAGNNLHNIAHYAEALHFFERSLSISREVSDWKLEGLMLNNIGQIYYAQGEYGKALEYLEQSLSIFREIGDKKGESWPLNNIAGIYIDKRDYLNAIKYLEQSLPLLWDINDRRGEGIIREHIGTIYNATGNYAAAMQDYEQALAISREIKNKQMESRSLSNISQVYQKQGKLDAALARLEQSLIIIRQISDRSGECAILNNIGGIYHTKGDYTAALKQYEQALAIAKEIGTKVKEAGGNWNIGCLYEDQGKLAKAEPYLSRAVQLEEQLGHPDLEYARKRLEAVRAKLRGQR